jgi:hypothetical protein
VSSDLYNFDSAAESAAGGAKITVPRRMSAESDSF